MEASVASPKSLSHRGRRGAPLPKRDDRKFREYLREERGSQPRGPRRAFSCAVGWERGCIAGRMQTNFGDTTLAAESRRPFLVRRARRGDRWRSRRRRAGRTPSAPGSASPKKRSRPRRRTSTPRTRAGIAPNVSTAQPDTCDPEDQNRHERRRVNQPVAQRTSCRTLDDNVPTIAQPHASPVYREPSRYSTETAVARRSDRAVARAPRTRTHTRQLVVGTSERSDDTLSPCAPVAQLDRATGFEPVGRGFDSLRAHHFIAESRRKTPRASDDRQPQFPIGIGQHIGHAELLGDGFPFRRHSRLP